MAERSVRELDPGVGELVLKAARGDEGSWDTLVERFAGMVWAVARGHRLSTDDAADVSQTTWLRLVEHLDRIEQPERVGAWLATTARRESLRVLRLAGRQIPTSDDDVVNLTDTPVVALDGNLLIEERDQALWEVFGRLPCRCQLILRLLTSDMPLSYRDLSDVLEMPIGSIGPTRARCLEHLRRLAAGAGILLPDEVS